MQPPEVIARYIGSANRHFHFWGAKTKEDIYEQFTDDVLNGYPVWDMMKLPEWTKYRCLTCKYYEVKHTQFGVLQKCIHERCCVNTNPIGRSKGMLNQLRRVCKLYSRKDNMK